MINNKNNNYFDYLIDSYKVEKKRRIIDSVTSWLLVVMLALWVIVLFLIV